MSSFTGVSDAAIGVAFRFGFSIFGVETLRLLAGSSLSRSDARRFSATLVRTGREGRSCDMLTRFLVDGESGSRAKHIK